MRRGFVAVVLAAGQGTRMKSALPKVLHPLCGRALVLVPDDEVHQPGGPRLLRRALVAAIAGGAGRHGCRAEGA